MQGVGCVYSIPTAIPTTAATRFSRGGKSFWGIGGVGGGRFSLGQYGSGLLMGQSTPLGQHSLPANEEHSFLRRAITLLAPLASHSIYCSCGLLPSRGLGSGCANGIGVW